MADEIKDTPKPLTDAEKVRLYEQNGIAKLYYSLNRKANEMGDLMNKHNLGTMTIDDPKDKTFDRLKVIWNDATSLATAVTDLGKIAKITGNEEEDVSNKPFVDTIADSRR